MAQHLSELGPHSTQSSYIEYRPMAQPLSELGSHQATLTHGQTYSFQYFIAVAPSVHNQAMLTSSQHSPLVS